MLDRIRQLLEERKDRASFFEVVDRFFPRGSAEYQLIERAYSTAKDAFREKYREGSGERYFEHLRAVALILMVHMRIRDANVIAAALLHDIVEDIKNWSQDRVAVEFNRSVAQLVWWVTKPDVLIFNGDKEARNRAYHQNLNRAPREALMIKLADRLHNLITLWGVDEDKQRRKVRETQDFYLSLAEKEVILIHEIEQALIEIMNSWKVQT
jgi:(p)ppGpp synthase/HD superfamily hydrolase